MGLDTTDADTKHTLEQCATLTQQISTLLAGNCTLCLPLSSESKCEYTHPAASRPSSNNMPRRVYKELFLKALHEVANAGEEEQEGWWGAADTEEQLLPARAMAVWHDDKMLQPSGNQASDNCHDELMPGQYIIDNLISALSLDTVFPNPKHHAKVLKRIITNFVDFWMMLGLTRFHDINLAAPGHITNHGKTFYPIWPESDMRLFKLFSRHLPKPISAALEDGTSALTYAQVLELIYTLTGFWPSEEEKMILQEKRYYEPETGQWHLENPEKYYAEEKNLLNPNRNHPEGTGLWYRDDPDEYYQEGRAPQGHYGTTGKSPHKVALFAYIKRIDNVHATDVERELLEMYSAEHRCFINGVIWPLFEQMCCRLLEPLDTPNPPTGKERAFHGIHRFFRLLATHGFRENRFQHRVKEQFTFWENLKQQFQSNPLLLSVAQAFQSRGNQIFCHEPTNEEVAMQQAKLDITKTGVYLLMKSSLSRIRAGAMAYMRNQFLPQLQFDVLQAIRDQSDTFDSFFEGAGIYGSFVDKVAGKKWVMYQVAVPDYHRKQSQETDERQIRIKVDRILGVYQDDDEECTIHVATIQHLKWILQDASDWDIEIPAITTPSGASVPDGPLATNFDRVAPRGQQIVLRASPTGNFTDKEIDYNADAREQCASATAYANRMLNKRQIISEWEATDTRRGGIKSQHPLKAVQLKLFDFITKVTRDTKTPDTDTERYFEEMQTMYPYFIKPYPNERVYKVLRIHIKEPKQTLTTHIQTLASREAELDHLVTQSDKVLGLLRDEKNNWISRAEENLNTAKTEYEKLQASLKTTKDGENVTKDRELQIATEKLVFCQARYDKAQSWFSKEFNKMLRWHKKWRTQLGTVRFHQGKPKFKYKGEEHEWPPELTKINVTSYDDLVEKFKKTRFREYNRGKWFEQRPQEKRSKQKEETTLDEKTTHRPTKEDKRAQRAQQIFRQQREDAGRRVLKKKEDADRAREKAGREGNFENGRPTNAQPNSKNQRFNQRRDKSAEAEGSDNNDDNDDSDSEELVFDNTERVRAEYTSEASAASIQEKESVLDKEEKPDSELFKEIVNREKEVLSTYQAYWDQGNYKNADITSQESKWASDPNVLIEETRSRLASGDYTEMNVRANGDCGYIAFAFGMVHPLSGAPHPEFISCYKFETEGTQRGHTLNLTPDRLMRKKASKAMEYYWSYLRDDCEKKRQYLLPLVESILINCLYYWLAAKQDGKVIDKVVADFFITNEIMFEDSATSEAENLIDNKALRSDISTVYLNDYITGFKDLTTQDIYDAIDKSIFSTYCEIIATGILLQCPEPAEVQYMCLDAEAAALNVYYGTSIAVVKKRMMESGQQWSAELTGNRKELPAYDATDSLRPQIRRVIGLVGETDHFLGIVNGCKNGEKLLSSGFDAEYKKITLTSGFDKDVSLGKFYE